MKRPTEKQKRLGKEWGWGEFEIEHGYGIFTSEYDLLVINRIDDMETFESDFQAVRQARKDGFKFIVNNIIDNAENRKIIEKEELTIGELREEWL